MKMNFEFDGYFPFDKYREYQRGIIDKTIGAFESGKKYVVLEAPTGIGKSVIAYTVGNYYLNTLDEGMLRIHKQFHGPPVIVCTKTRQLQKQYRDSFNDLERLWSSRHYFCALEPTHNEYYYRSPLCVENCPSMSECKFLRAKQKFMGSDFGVLNYHYYIYSLFDDKFKPKALVLDEAHNIENILCDIFTLNINGPKILETFEKASEKGLIDKFDINNIEIVIEDIIKTKTINEYLIENLKKLKIYVDKVIEVGSKELRAIKETWGGEIRDREVKETAIHISKFIISLETLADKLNKFILGDADWMISDRKEDQLRIKFKPLEIGYLSDKLFNSSKRILLMSATICGVDQFCKDINIDRSRCEFISTPSVIPPKNRKVLFINVGVLNYKNKEEVLPKIISKMDDMIDLVEKEKGSVRGIIHSVSYTNATTVKKQSKHNNRMIIPVGSEVMDIDEILQIYDNTIVVSPSIMEGVDLKDDLSRFQMFPKVPFLSLEDKWVVAKMKKDNVWYTRKAIMNIVQGSGRSIRTETDWSITIIFDGSFDRLLRQYKRLFPMWYLDALTLIKLNTV